MILQCRWEVSPVLPLCPTSIKPIRLHVIQKLTAGEVIVKVDMMVLVLQLSCQLLDNMCPKPYHSLFSLACIHVESTKEAIGAIPQYPHLDPTLDWPLWHVLF